jgi:hypothetical protein
MDLMRYEPDSPNGRDGIHYGGLMLWGRDQGYKWFHLGMAPLSGLKHQSNTPSGIKLEIPFFTLATSSTILRACITIRYKFEPVWQPKYLVVPGNAQVAPALLAVTSIISGGFIGVFKKMIRRTLGLGMAMFLWAGVASADAIQESTDTYGPFGTLHIYKSSDHPSHIVLFISVTAAGILALLTWQSPSPGSTAWWLGLISPITFRKSTTSARKCTYGAAQFEGLSQFLQKKLGFSHYIPPVLVGYSSGATMVYATLAQSPPNTFAGGISLAFAQISGPFILSAKKRYTWSLDRSQIGLCVSNGG